MSSELTRDVNDAEDGAQDACVQALKYAGSLNGGVRAWFLTVRHAFYDRCKRNRPAEMARDDSTAIDTAVDPAAVLRGADVRSDAPVIDQQLVRSHR